MANEIALKPTYWASVSGGKDSLYMLYYILNHLDKYPLDGVCHFDCRVWDAGARYLGMGKNTADI